MFDNKSIRSLCINCMTIGIAVTILAVLGIGSLAAAKSNVEIPLLLTTDFQASVAANMCDNSPGPYITLSGKLTLEGINGRLIFKNNKKGTHTRNEDVMVDITILDPGETIRFAKQPPQGGVGGNPHILIQFFDGSWNPISEEIYLGRCVQGFNETINADLDMHSVANVSVTTGECRNSPGPYITLEGELTLGGINAKLIFKNNLKGTHTRDDDVTVDIIILAPGETISFAKQPPEGGVGGNPLIYFQFNGENNEAMTEAFFIGRCVQLGR